MHGESLRHRPEIDFGHFRPFPAISGHFRPFPAILGRQQNGIPADTIPDVRAQVRMARSGGDMPFDELNDQVRESGHYPPISYPIEAVPDVTGIPRTKIFGAVKANQLTVRKAGRSTIVEHPELVRYIKTLPTKGRKPEADVASGHLVPA
jgi:hypothetical protein